MSRRFHDPPQTEMPPRVNATGPSAAIDKFDDAIEYRNLICYQEIIPIDQAYKEAVKQAEKGQGFWRGKRHPSEHADLQFQIAHALRARILHKFGGCTRKRASTKALLDKSSSREQVE